MRNEYGANEALAERAFTQVCRPGLVYGRVNATRRASWVQRLTQAIVNFL